MKINIQIEDATPEEARQFFSTIRNQKTARRGSAKNFHNVWTPEEHEAIQNCQDRNEAWTRYHEKFPESPRTQEAVFRMWLAKKETATAAPAHNPADDLPAETPPVKKGAKAVGETSKATGNRYHNKWKIPFDSVKEPGKYEAARKLCRKVGKPYDEAIKAVATTPEKKSKRGGNHRKTTKSIDKVQCPQCQKMCDPRGLHKHMLSHRRLETAPSVSQSNSDKITMPEIVTGIHVRQVKPVDGKKFFGTATVMERTGDLVTVRNGGGKKYTLDVRNLEIATKPEKTPKNPEVKESSRAITSNDDEKEPDIEIAGTEGLHSIIEHEKANHVEAPPEPLKPTISAKEAHDKIKEMAAKNGVLSVGIHVKQVGGQKVCAGIGVIKRAPQGQPEVLVQFENAMEWLPRQYLQVVPDAAPEARA